MDKKAKKTCIQVNVSLLPASMDRHYLSHLVETVRTKYEGKAFRTLGIVLKVERLVEILKQEIMAMDGMVSFLVKIEIRSYFPRVHDVLQVTIDKILPHGIFIADKNMRIFVPLNLCSEYVIEKDFTSFYAQHRPTMELFRKDSRFAVTLIEIRFENDSFSCIAAPV